MLSDQLGPLLRRPVVVAPMAGGPTTPALVAAAGPVSRVLQRSGKAVTSCF